MPIPALTKHGLLPPGIYECTFAEIEAVFCHIPPEAERAALWKEFLRFVDEVRKVGLVMAMYIDGGFTTAVRRANDVDVVLELPPPSPAARAMAKSQIFNAKLAKQMFRVHLFMAPAWTTVRDDMREYFQLANPKDAAAFGFKPGQKKGLLKVTL